MTPTAQDIVGMLDLKPHPEGGWYRETFRDENGVDGRPRSTAIYFLLARGEISHWHRVDAVETWHWHAGASLTLSVFKDGVGISELRLGSDLAAGERPQAIVPPHAWQSAKSEGDWTLVGCTVTPGFEFSGFELAPPGWSPDQSDVQD
jgi:predicted cupin superfamily sugar epimerase